jgi:hypothetical protein
VQKYRRKLIKKAIEKRICKALPIKMARNCEYKKEDIVNTILLSIADNVSIEYSSERMRKKGIKAPSGDDIFYHLNSLETKDVLSAFYSVNSEILRKERHKRAPCAIDIHKIPYYGEHRDKHVVGMEKARGTNYGYAYASIDCIDKKALTLSAIPLNQLTTKEEIITPPINEARKYVSISRVFLDRGFFNAESIRALIALNVPFVIPAVKNKRVNRIIEKAHLKSKHIPCTNNKVFITDYVIGKNDIAMKLVVILDFKGKECSEFAYVTDMDVTPDKRYPWQRATGRDGG